MTAKKKQKVEKNISDKVFSEVVDDLDRFEDFFSANLKQIVIGAVLIMIALTVGFVVYNQIQEAEMKSCVALAEAKGIKELNEAIKQNPNSKGADNAKLNLGTLYFKAGKYQEALDTYQNLANSAEPGDIQGRAKLNSAYTLEAMKKKEQAAERFSEIGMDANAPAYIRDEANYSAGRLFIDIEKPSRAASALKSVKTETPNGFWNVQAQRLLQRLEAKDPSPQAGANPMKQPAVKVVPAPEKTTPEKKTSKK